VIEIALGTLMAAAVKLVAEGAATKTGEEGANTAIKLLGWMRGKLTGRAKEALDNVEAAPSSEDNQADLRKQLTKLPETHPELVPRVVHIAGYSLFSFTRASAVVNCQSVLTCLLFRLSSHAATSSVRVSLSGIRRSRH
jgi:hypothetical protein